MGGVGKSPMVAHLAARLREAGHNPAILTRGYKRESCRPSRHRPAREQRFSRSNRRRGADVRSRRGDAHVGIGADRFAVGQRMERELAPDVFLLDDGFQHTRLARTHDIVLIDALDPLAGGVFPLGRLREPLSALARATDDRDHPRPNPAKIPPASNACSRGTMPKRPCFARAWFRGSGWISKRGTCSTADSSAWRRFAVSVRHAPSGGRCMSLEFEFVFHRAFAIIIAIHLRTFNGSPHRQPPRARMPGHHRQGRSESPRRRRPAARAA